MSQNPPQSASPRINQRLLKTQRLRKRFEFLRVAKKGTRKFGKYISVEILTNNKTTARLGITVTKRYGKAHERNRFKRIVREAYRHLREDLPAADLVVHARPLASQGCTPALIAEELRALTCA